MKEERGLSREYACFSRVTQTRCVLVINLFFRPTLSSLQGVFMQLENYLASL